MGERVTEGDGKRAQKYLYPLPNGEGVGGGVYQKNYKQ